MNKKSKTALFPECTVKNIGPKKTMNPPTPNPSKL